jgi:hypothetical protein
MEAVDFVDEEEVAVLQIRQNPGEIARFFNLGTAREVDLSTESTGKDVGEGGFAEPGRAAEEDVIEGVIPSLGCLNHEHEALFHLRLATEFLKVRRAQALLEVPRRLAGRVAGRGVRHGGAFGRDD